MYRVTVQTSGAAAPTINYRKVNLGLSREGRGHYSRSFNSLDQIRQFVREVDAFTRDDFRRGGMVRVGLGNFIGTPRDLLTVLGSEKATASWGIAG